MKTKKYRVTFVMEVEASRVPKGNEAAIDKVSDLAEKIWDHEERADDPNGIVEDSYGFEAEFIGEGESDD